MPKVTDNTPHMVRVFQGLNIKGYEAAKSWEFAENIMDSDNEIQRIQAMIRNYEGTEVEPFVKLALDFCFEGQFGHSRKSAMACVAIAHAIVNFHIYARSGR